MLSDDNIIQVLLKAFEPYLNQYVDILVENKIKAYQLKIDDEDDDMSLTRKEVQEKLKISPQTAHNYTHNGTLMHRFVGGKYLYSKTQIKELSTVKPKPRKKN